MAESAQRNQVVFVLLAAKGTKDDVVQVERHVLRCVQVVPGGTVPGQAVHEATLTGGS